MTAKSLDAIGSEVYLAADKSKKIVRIYYAEDFSVQKFSNQKAKE